MAPRYSYSLNPSINDTIQLIQSKALEELLVESLTQTYDPTLPPTHHTNILAFSPSLWVLEDKNRFITLEDADEIRKEWGIVRSKSPDQKPSFILPEVFSQHSEPERHQIAGAIQWFLERRGVAVSIEQILEETKAYMTPLPAETETEPTLTMDVPDASQDTPQDTPQDINCSDKSLEFARSELEMPEDDHPEEEYQFDPELSLPHPPSELDDHLNASITYFQDFTDTTHLPETTHLPDTTHVPNTLSDAEVTSQCSRCHTMDFQCMTSSATSNACVECVRAKRPCSLVGGVGEPEWLKKLGPIIDQMKEVVVKGEAEGDVKDNGGRSAVNKLILFEKANKRRFQTGYPDTVQVKPEES